MSNKKKQEDKKIAYAIRLKPEMLKKVNDLKTVDPMAFSTKTRVLEAAIDFFIHSPLEIQVQAVRDYLTRNLK